MSRPTIAMLVVVLAAGLTGCLQFPRTNPVAAPPPPAPPRPEPRIIEAPPDLGPQGEDTDLVKMASLLEEQLSQARKELKGLKKEDRDLREKERKLLDQVARLEAELAQAHKELADANELLLEMRKDLDRWQMNVLGFREELINAQRAQLEATNKVLKLLGGEVSEPTTRPAPKEAAKTNETPAKPGA